MIWVVVALLLALVGLFWQALDYVKAEQKKKRDRIAECAARGHNWCYASVYDEGYQWVTYCAARCGVQPIHLKIEDVPDAELEKFRKAREARIAKRRKAGL